MKGKEQKLELKVDVFCILLAHFTTAKSTHANYYRKQKVMAQSHIVVVFTFIGVLGQ